MMLEPLRPVPPALVDVTGSARPRAPGSRSRADEPKVWAAAAELRAGVGASMGGGRTGGVSTSFPNVSLSSFPQASDGGLRRI
ncbi:unnamed protein product [Urochloa humidicola]